MKNSEDKKAEIEKLETRIFELNTERESLVQQVRELRETYFVSTPESARLLDSGLHFSPAAFPGAPLSKESPEADRVAFYRDLFHGRRDVYAERFESRRTGKSGYQPVCANLWKRPLCQKPKIKCHQCPHRVLVPLSEAVIRQHLAGETTVGIHPMLLSETCRLLAADFDNDGWQEDP